MLCTYKKGVIRDLDVFLLILPVAKICIQVQGYLCWKKRSKKVKQITAHEWQFIFITYNSDLLITCLKKDSTKCCYTPKNGCKSKKCAFFALFFFSSYCSLLDFGLQYLPAINHKNVICISKQLLFCTKDEPVWKFWPQFIISSDLK